MTVCADDQEAQFLHLLIMKKEHKKSGTPRPSSSPDPQSEAAASFRLGNQLSAAGRTSDAEAAYLHSAELLPSAPEPHYNLGRLYAESARLREAETEYRKALARAPGHADSRFNLSLLLLSEGRLEEGFALFESRRAQKSYRESARFPFNEWTGEDLHGKSIVVCPEQGLGDQIQCLRFLPQLRALGAKRITLVCSAPLKTLFLSFPEADLVLSQEDAEQGIALHDYQILSFSLPRHLKTTLATLPGTIPYLFADTARIEKWQGRLGAEGIKIGLVWKGSTTHANDAHRSLSSLAELAPLWKIPDLSFFSLQKGEAEAETLSPLSGQAIVPLGQDITDFSDTAAIIAQLDLVICVDTAVAHLAGALGKPCWVLLPALDTDWRWFRGRTDSPWYPSLRLFRQESAQSGWMDVVTDIAGQLAHEPIAQEEAPPGARKTSALLLVEQTSPTPRSVSSPQENPPIAAIPRKSTKMPSSKSELSFEQTLAAHQAGDLEGARRGYEALLRLKPRDFGATHMLGVIHAQRNEWQLALPLLRKAVQLNPHSAEALYNQGVAEAQLGNSAEAIALYKRALRLAPAHLNARFNLSCLYTESKDFASAEALLQGILGQEPNYPGAARNLGGVLRQLKRTRDALAAYRKALVLTPESPELFSDISATLSDLREAIEAEKWANLALKLAPGMSAALNNLGVARRLQDDDEGAQSNFSAAISADPDNVAALLNLGALLVRTDREIDLAEALIERAIALDPSNPIGHLLQGSLRAAGGDFKEALVLFERTLPLLDEGNQEEYYPVYLFFLMHNADTPPEASTEAHRRWGEILYQSVAAEERASSSFENDRNAERPLRIGFVSGDLRNHAVLHFLEPTLQGLDRSRYLPIAYSTNSRPDSVSDWAKTQFSGWRDVYGMPDSALRQQIIADGIDILIDLSGHTNLNRMRLFAMRAAPVQASWIGYPGTTGLRNMDYFLTDRFFTPRGSEALFTEKLVRLPVVDGFAPFPDLPPLLEPPCCRTGHFTFGSFNRRLKITPDVISIWARIMNAVPASMMIFGAIDRKDEMEALKSAFESHGISATRLEFLHRTIVADYLLRHQQIDLILDAFPYTGGTTSRHALWMGVPTLTSTGPSPAHNQGADLMLSVGLDEFVVPTPEAMIARAVEIATDIESLRTLRLGMRDLLDASELRNSPRLGANFGKALREMWRNWCQGNAPVEIEVSND